MINLTTKVLAGLFVSGIGVSATFLTHKLLKGPSNIKEKLESEGYKALNTIEGTEVESSGQNDYSEWNAKISEWTEDNNKLTTFIGKSPKDLDTNARITALKDKCREILKNSVDNEKYNLAKDYCAITDLSNKKTSHKK